MKNSLPSVLLLLPILLISIGMYSSYTSSQSAIYDSMNEMSNREIEAFNTQFTIYEGEQTGARLKSLMGTLIANANTYSEEPEKVLEVTAEIFEAELDNVRSNITVIKAEYSEDSEEEMEDYIQDIAKIRNNLENKHTYVVSFEYSNSGVLNKIIIER